MNLTVDVATGPFLRLLEGGSTFFTILLHLSPIDTTKQEYVEHPPVSTADFERLKNSKEHGGQITPR